MELIRQLIDMACPIDDYTKDVINTLVKHWVIGLDCGKVWTSKPPALSALINDYRRNIHSDYRQKYHAVDPIAMEVFGFHHGLRHRIPQQLMVELKNKSILDIGAFIGDSALILSEYGKDVYSFELSASNFASMKRVLRANPRYSQNVHPVYAGVSDHSGEMQLGDSGGVGMNLGWKGQAGTVVPLVTIDEFTERNKLTIGFLKGDVEGFGLAIVKGAIKTLKRDRPIISMAAYHHFDEIHGMSVFLVRELSDYHWEWQMQNGCADCWFELGFFGHPVIRANAL
jgi:FkbM family methyltransferase